MKIYLLLPNTTKRYKKLGEEFVHTLLHFFPTKLQWS